MLAALIRLWRRSPVVVYAIVGAILAVIAFAYVPFPPGVKPLSQAFVALLLWVFASCCVTGVAWAIETVALLARWIGGKGKAPAARPLRHAGPLPELSAGKQPQVRRAVKLLSEAGIFREKLDPAMLYPGVAEREARVKPDIVFEALVEATYYHPDFDAAPYRANLVLHETQVEQPEAYLIAQIADLARLSGGALAIADIAVEQARRADTRTVDTRIAMTVNGEPVTLAYPGEDKYLSTVLHHDLATRLRALDTGQRLEWRWTDAGPWISCLADGDVERLNEAFTLKPSTPCRWEWIDCEAPIAAGAAAHSLA
ncbi:hypothetical protein [Sphingomonas sp.]|uniref:hypothetical protein n=1 Tax=Sphingomonas sp. TaxID=28214 RepID=UPI003341F22E